MTWLATLLDLIVGSKTKAGDSQDPFEELRTKRIEREADAEAKLRERLADLEKHSARVNVVVHNWDKTIRRILKKLKNSNYPDAKSTKTEIEGPLNYQDRGERKTYYEWKLLNFP